MPPALTKLLGLFLPLIIGALAQPDIQKLWAGHPSIGNLVAGGVTLLAGYLGIGVSGPTVAPKLAAAMGNPPGAKADEPK